MNEKKERGFEIRLEGNALQNHVLQWRARLKWWSCGCISKGAVVFSTEAARLG